MLQRGDYFLNDQLQGGQVWKTANGTTGTFATRKSILQETVSTLLSLGRNTDAGMWLSLTKHHVLNPYDLLTQPFIFPYRGASLAFAWLLNWRQIVFGRRYTLFVPVPSIASHMSADLLALQGGVDAQQFLPRPFQESTSIQPSSEHARSFPRFESSSRSLPDKRAKEHRCWRVSAVTM